MGHEGDKRTGKSRIVGGTALLGAFLAPGAALAQSQDDNFQMPRTYIGEYLEATHPDLGDDAPRSDPLERRYRRFEVDENIERGLGDVVERGLNWGLRPLGIGLSPDLETRVTNDEVRGEGARLQFRLRLNPIRPEERRR